MEEVGSGTGALKKKKGTVCCYIGCDILHGDIYVHLFETAVLRIMCVQHCFSGVCIYCTVHC